MGIRGTIPRPLCRYGAVLCLWIAVVNRLLPDIMLSCPRRGLQNGCWLTAPRGAGVWCSPAVPVVGLGVRPMCVGALGALWALGDAPQPHGCWCAVPCGPRLSARLSAAARPPSVGLRARIALLAQGRA